MTATTFSVMISIFTSAAAPLPATGEETKAVSLVEQLGAKSFRTREMAAKELVNLGAASMQALQRGTKSEDAEVADRCKKLLPQAYEFYVLKILDEVSAKPDTPIPPDLPGAKRWVELAGTSKEAKELYTDMVKTHRVLLSDLEQNPSQVTQKYRDFVQEIYTRTRGNFNVSSGNQVVSPSEMILFLFLATDPNNKGTGTENGARSYLPVYTILNQAKWTTFLAPKTGVEPIKRMFVQFVEKETNPNILRRALMIAGNAELKECIPAAIKMAKEKNNLGMVRSYALTSLIKMGDQSTIKELLPLMEDKGVIVNMNLGNGVKSVEVRDVAMGVALLISKQSMTDFGYEGNPPTTTSPTLSVSFSYFGFADDEKRQSAIKKWKAYAEKEGLLK